MRFSSKRLVMFLVLLAAAAGFGVSTVFAEEAGGANVSTTEDLVRINKELTSKIVELENKLTSLESRMTQTEREISKSKPVSAAIPVIPSPPGVEVSGGPIHMDGFVDTSFNWNFQSPQRGSDGNSTLRAFDDNANTFDLNNIELSLSRPAPQDKGGVGFKTVFMYGTDAENVASAGSAASSDPDEFSIQQGFLDLHIPIGSGLGVWVGKFATLHGAEVIENHLNWNSSRSFLFNLAIPFTHTGARAVYKFLGGKLKTQLGLVNGWDQGIDTNDFKDIESQVSYAPNDNLFASIGWMYGPQRVEDRNHPRGLVDAVVKVKPLPEALPKLELMANYDYGWEDDIGDVVGASFGANEDGVADWQGYALYARYHLYDWLTLAARWEQFFDEQGARAALMGADGLGLRNVKLWSMTYTADLKWFENLLTRLEYRRDHSSKDNTFDPDFLGAGIGTEDNQDTAGVSMIYLFG